jgi:hypothetical protein|tara:strand:- start:93 stop:287 length:195 start_codon:yes stop_codon:yes gene_type:complete
MTKSRLTTASFSVRYYDGDTGEEIETVSFLNNTGKVKDRLQFAVENKPEHNGILLWDFDPLRSL